MSVLVERLNNLQKANTDLDSALQEIWRSLPYHPEKAFTEFVKADEQFHTSSQEWEEWLQDFEAFNAENSGDFRALTESIIDQTEQFLAQGKGMALALLGRLAEAQREYERSIAALGDNTHPSHASLAEALGQIALQQAKFNEAEQHFRRAYDAHLQFAVSDAWNGIVDSNDAGPSARLSLEGAARNLGNLAQVALLREERKAFLQRQLEAVEFANIHGLSHLAKSLWLNLYKWELQWDVRGALSDALKQKLDELERGLDSSERAGLEVDKLLLEADNSIFRTIAARAKARLNEAERILNKNPHLIDKRWSLHLAFSSFYEWQEEIATAIEHAEAALAIAKQMGLPDLIQQATDTLVALLISDEANAEQQAEASQRLDETIELLRHFQPGEALAQTLLQRAWMHLSVKQYDAALADGSEAETHVKSPALRRLVLTARAAALKMSGQKTEALSTLETAIQLCREQMLPQGQPSARSYRDLLHHTEILHEGAALLAAELGRVHEAFDWAEEGKTRLLRQQLAQSGSTPQDGVWQIPEVSYDKNLQRSLQAESAAFLFFCVGTGRTLALLLDPQEAEPQPFFVDLKEADLHETKLAKGLWPARGRSEHQFMQFLSYLSDKLLEPIGDVLQNVMNRCKVLYIVPDSRLYLVPFSALTLKGIPLVEHDHCALALTPSVALWQWCRMRRQVDRERSCLVVGAGRAGDFSLADQARAIMAGCNWNKAPTYLLDDEGMVTGERVWQTAKQHTVVHFSCHGMEEPMTLDTLSALYLELSDHDKWYAKDIFDHKNQLSAELVFLNACMSGRFRLREGAAIGGFWEAFLHAGATSIIATLAEVHPEDAEQLAQSFYQVWLQDNVTKARALQLAQQELRSKKPESFHWARYVLIGDYR